MADNSMKEMLQTIERDIGAVPMPRRRQAEASERPLFSSDKPDENRFDFAGETMAKAMVEMYEAAAKQTEAAGEAMMQRANDFDNDCKETAKQLRARGAEVADTLKLNAELCKTTTANLAATRDLVFPPAAEPKLQEAG